MGARQTSIDCYNKIKASGLLSKRRLEVYKSILENAPCTSNEIFKSLNLPTNQSGRFTELEDLGVIYGVGVRECAVTKRIVTEWDLTDRLPTNKSKPKTKSKKQKVNDALLMITALGKKLPEQYKEELRDIYSSVKEI